MGESGKDERLASSEEKQLGTSLRIRFAAYVILLICALVACAFMLLNLTGAINPANRSIEQTLDHQLDVTAEQLGRDIDSAAANGIALSHQLSELIDAHLSHSGLSIDLLAGNPERIDQLELELFTALQSSMRATACSGAFFILDVTANAASRQDSFAGLYLKYANIHSQNTSSNRICLFRGASNVARENEMNLHSSWQLETAAGTFPQCESLLGANVDDLAQAYFVTETYALPDTWENVRFICLPILDEAGRSIGACGFEMSDLYFQLSYKAIDATSEYGACALLDSPGPETKGCIAGSQSGYAPGATSDFIVSAKGSLTTLESSELGFIGKTTPLPESRSTHVVAALMPLTHYEALLADSRLKLTLSLLITLVVALGASWLAGKRYVAPVATRLVHLRQMHERERAETENHFSVLADQRRDEVHPHDLEGFLIGLDTLTPKERMIYQMHVDGLSTAEILRRAEINQNTLKYHNRNIYVKLGVSSRKQLQLIATTLKYSGRPGKP